MSARKNTPLKMLDGVIYAMMIIAVLYVLIQAMLGNNGTLAFKLTLGIWIMAAIVIMDYVEPVASHRFDSVTAGSFGWYTAYSILDGAMYMCLYVFVINVSMVREPLHYVYFAAAVLLFLIRKIIFRRYRTTVKRASEEDKRVIKDMNAIDVLPGDEADKPDEDELREMIYRERKE